MKRKHLSVKKTLVVSSHRAKVVSIFDGEAVGKVWISLVKYNNH